MDDGVSKFGLHDDGSFTLSPEAYEKLKEIMKQRDLQVVLPNFHKQLLDDLANAIWEHQRHAFEVYS